MSGPKDEGLDDVMADERGRYRRRGAPRNSAAQAKQRQREQEQKDDERLLRQAIRKRDRKRVMDAMRTLGASPELIARVEKLWEKLPPK